MAAARTTSRLARIARMAAALAALQAMAACAHDKSATAPPLPACTVPAPITLGIGQYTSFDPAADSGCVSFAANASTTDTAEYLVVLQAAGGLPGDSAPFSLRTETAAPLALAGSAAAPPRVRNAVATAFDLFRHRLAARSARSAPAPAPSAAATAGPQLVTPPAVGSQRTFSKVCANLTCSTFKAVTARVWAVGGHVAIYVDTLAPAGGLDTAQADTLQQIFDSRAYPIDTAAFGRESDIDTNGVVIALLTPVVNAMVTANQCDTSGFVVGFFYSPDLDPVTASQYNHGEIFYAIVPDPLGTLSCAHSTTQVMTDMPVTFMHEFQHMINYVQHVLVRGGQPEEDWLDEGLSKYAEELGGRSYLPADTVTFLHYTSDDLYDAYQYFLAPQSHFLLTTTDQSAADVGAGWLYVRYLVDRFGPALTRSLVQTSLAGTANVAAQTGAPFETSAERWALANWISDLPGFAPPPELQYSSWSFRSVFAGLNFMDQTDFPKPWPLEPPFVFSGGSVNLSGSLRAGSAQYLLAIQPPSGAAITLHVNYGASAIPASLVPRLSVIRFR